MSISARVRTKSTIAYAEPTAKNHQELLADFAVNYNNMYGDAIHYLMFTHTEDTWEMDKDYFKDIINHLKSLDEEAIKETCCNEDINIDIKYFKKIINLFEEWLDKADPDSNFVIVDWF